MNTPWSVMAASAALLLLPLLSGCASRAETILVRQLRYGDSWRQVHAAEALIDADRQAGEIATLFRGRLAESSPDSPWRVGCLRVLYRLCPAERPALREQLAQIAFAPTPGRIHAIETMGKLGLTLTADERIALKRFAETEEVRSCYGWLLLAVNGDRQAMKILEDRLRRGDTGAAFGFFYLTGITPEHRRLLYEAACDSGHAESLRIFAWKAWLRHGGNAATVRSRLPAESLTLLKALDSGLTRNDAPWLERMLESPEPEQRIAASRALLQLP